MFLLTCNTLLTSYSSTRRNYADRKNLTCLTRDIFQRSISFFLDPSLRAHLCSYVCVCVCVETSAFFLLLHESLPFNRWKNKNCVRKRVIYILFETNITFQKLLKFKEFFPLFFFFFFKLQFLLLRFNFHYSKVKNPSWNDFLDDRFLLFPSFII